MADEEVRLENIENSLRVLFDAAVRQSATAEISISRQKGGCMTKLTATLLSLTSESESIPVLLRLGYQKK
jgi:hypothetical protein